MSSKRNVKRNKDWAKARVKCQIWLHKLITPMKSPFCVEVHNVSTHLIFL
jgi:hypothetical protein